MFNRKWKCLNCERECNYKSIFKNICDTCTMFNAWDGDLKKLISLSKKNDKGN